MRTNNTHDSGFDQNTAITKRRNPLDWLVRLGPAPRLALAFILYLGVRWFILGTIPPIHFSDSDSYIEQYRNGFGAGLFTRVRTWGYPLVIWFLGHDLGLVVTAQRLAGAVAWFGLAVAAAAMFTSAAARRVAFWGILLISLTLFSVVWDAMILSESFSNSLFIALTAAWIWFLGARGAGLRPLAFIAALAIPFAGMRDANLFLLYFLIAGLAPALALRCFRGPSSRPPRRDFWIGAGLVGFIGLIGLGHSWDMHVCRRNWQSVGAVLSMRVYMQYVRDENGNILPVPNEEDIAWLAEHYGLPPQDARERVGKTVYEPPPLSPQYERWLKETGPHALLGFMAGHLGWVIGTFNFYPVYRVNNAELYLQPTESWAKARLALPNAIQKTIRLTLQPLISIMWINIALMLAAALTGLGWLARGWRRGLDRVTCWLALLFWLDAIATMVAFVSIFGDFYEPWRHSITGLMALYTAFPMTLALAVEFLMKRFRKIEQFQTEPTLCSRAEA